MPIFLAQTNIETKKYWWCCSKCHGEYLCSIPIRREVKNSCPYCSDEEPLKGLNTLLDLYPDLDSMWDVENNHSTEEIVLNTKSNKRYLWHCNTCHYNFRERLNVVLERYLKSNPPSTDNVCPNCTDRIIPDHRYKKMIKERILLEKRSMEPCIICKGRRRKREHFVPYK